jgi:hypothetical protein
VTLQVDAMKEMPLSETADGRTVLTAPFRCVWEDRLPTLEVEVVLTRVVLGEGTHLTFEPLDVFSRGDQIWPATSTLYRVFDPPKDPARAAEIRGIVTAAYGVGKDVIEIPNVLGGGPRSAMAGKVTLTAAPMRAAGGRAMLKLEMTVDGEGPVNPTTFPASSPYAVHLVDPQGSTHGCRVMWGGTARRVGTFPGPDGRPEGGIDIREAGETLLIFDRLPSIPGPWKLVYAIPKKLETREYPFRLADVPLPHGPAAAAPPAPARPKAGVKP